MNTENKYFDEKTTIPCKLFYNLHHSSLMLRTRTAKKISNTELIRSDVSAVPLLTMKHLKKVKDPMKEFMKTKHEFLYKKKRLESRLVRQYKIKKLSRNCEVSRRDMKEYILHTLFDPFPYVDPVEGFYFYPHHGTLKCIETENSEYLAYVENDNTIRFDEIKSVKMLTKLDVLREGVATELLCHENSDLAAIRYRNEVKIGRLPDMESIKDGDTIKILDYSFENKNDILASSMHDIFLSIIDSSARLRRFDVEHQYQDVDLKLEKYFKNNPIIPVSLSNPVGDIIPKHSIAFTIRDCFGIVDVRNKSNISLEKYFSSEDFVMKCEKIFSHCQSLLDKNIVYIATSHMVYAFDYRKLNKPIVQWAHQLYYPPMMITTTMYGLTEIICVSSNTVGDLKVFHYDGSSVNYFPYKPDSIESTHNKLKECGLFLLSDEIQSRIDANTTGVVLYSNRKSQNIKLYTQNHYGDIFESTLNCSNINRDDYSKRLAIERFQKWENFLEVPHNPNRGM